MVVRLNLSSIGQLTSHVYLKAVSSFPLKKRILPASRAAAKLGFLHAKRFAIGFLAA